MSAVVSTHGLGQPEQSVVSSMVLSCRCDNVATLSECHVVNAAVNLTSNLVSSQHSCSELLIAHRS